MVTKGKVVNAGTAQRLMGRFVVLKPVMASPAISRQALPHM